MITREVRLWLDKIKKREYPIEDILPELSKFSHYLTKEELKFIKTKIEESYSF